MLLVIIGQWQLQSMLELAIYFVSYGYSTTSNRP
jgi:hypothetical protein